MTADAMPAVVAMHLWGTRHVAASVRRMASQRRSVRSLPGCTFSKLLGTSSGTFAVRDADLHHWAVLSCWSDVEGPARFEASGPFAAWDSDSHEMARVLLRPVHSRGTWSGQRPFGDVTARSSTGIVAAVTRARIRPTQWLGFWRSVEPVSIDAHAGGGLLLGLGIGEAPVGLQGTFSVWRDAEALRDFAYRRGPHTAAITRTGQTGWYAEELFARFEVLELSGRYRDLALAELA